MAATLQARYAPAAEAKGLALRFEGDDRTMLTDPVLLERLLGNLLDNAIKYTDAGAVTLRAGAVGANLRIEVADTGRGIPAALLGRVFEEFFQVGNPERDRAKGLGIGLSIVQRTGRLLGHALDLRSVERVGSTFSVDVPLAEAPNTDAPNTDAPHADAPFAHAPAGGAASQPTAPAATGPVPAPTDDSLRDLFVLVIDDERDVRDAMASVLAAWGCSVACAASGAQAVQTLAGHLRDPDLIICDYRLRDGEDGVGAVERVRRAIGLPIAALIVTGDLDAPTRERLRASGLALARKPLHGASLRRRILAAVASGPARPA